MNRILLIIICLFFIQCEGMFGGSWYTYVQNDADHDIIFEIDVEDLDGKVYAKYSIDDPTEYTVEFAKQKVYANSLYSYQLFTYRYKAVKITCGDSVSIYVYHPDTLAKYSWEEIKMHHKYDFERTIIPDYPYNIIYPF